MKRFIYAIALFLGIMSSISLSHAADAIVEEVDEGGPGKVLPKILSQPPPVFPASLARSGAGGKVIVTFTVSEDGSVRDAVVTSSPQRLLNPYAIKAVGAWRFEPGTRNGQPATFRLKASVEFSANAEESTSKADSPKAFSKETNRTTSRQSPGASPHRFTLMKWLWLVTPDRRMRVLWSIMPAGLCLRSPQTRAIGPLARRSSLWSKPVNTFPEERGRIG
jgi:TonB family protein